MISSCPDYKVLVTRHTLPVTTVKIVVLPPRPWSLASRLSGKKAKAPVYGTGAFDHHEIRGIIAGNAGSVAYNMAIPAQQSDLFSPSSPLTAIAATTPPRQQ
jgi:hypothetical protein